MIETTTIARPYAKAAFEAAIETNTLDSWDRFLKALSETVNHPDVMSLFDNPQMTNERLLTFVDSVMSDALKAEYRDDQREFVQLLAENRRFDAISDIQTQFEAQLDAHNNVAQAHITSAFPIDDETLASLTKTLEDHYGQKIRADVTVDPSLIGGVRIAVGDQVIDASVREKLNSLAAALTQ